ncbi:helix-turn-helix domain-containing protein [Rossellomorea marisflavi]|uniref:helix-turn-helix domain-containing protein n=1 Tax=Rossellomorea marisflavi TaxID=189381 RepID=UPI00345ABC88
MNEMPMKIGDNIRKIRKERGLSLDQVAERTGVSKAMIGQIERDDSNPTVATLWKIANGLKVSFSSLLEAPAADVAIIDYKDVEPVLEDGGKYVVIPIFPFEPTKKWESYRIVMKPGCDYRNDGHPRGVEEYLTVLKGTFSLKIGEASYSLSEGESIRFEADVAHEYLNPSPDDAECHMVIYYGELL